MAEQRFTVGDQITVVVTGEMTDITPDGTLTVQYPSSLGACETHVELEDTSVVVMHERDADKATPVLIEERDSARAEVKRLRAERDAARVGMEKLRGLHRGVCVGACGLDDACECEERDLACAECAASWPCATIRALDGTEAGQ